ncbi:MAG TPA: dihydroxyacetone kinase subunit DhaL [Candidatus Limnocylindrales bacterium]|nr:dihydroxyacetone kinase subunit DhaL [Candidatus Limnocylindrales bacterium]
MSDRRRRLIAAWLRRSAEVLHERRTWLTDLDAAIGDGDHGINLDRGFGLVVARLEAGELEAADGARLLEAAGRTILGTVGGASGALYGRALARAGASLADHPPGPHARPAARAATALAAAAQSVVALGRSAAGDKTMLDALLPAVAAAQAAAEKGRSLEAALAAAAAAAAAGAQATVPLIARRGRASYLGERSIGHLDPGAASTALLLAALAEVASTRRPEL